MKVHWAGNAKTQREIDELLSHAFYLARLRDIGYPESSSERSYRLSKQILPRMSADTGKTTRQD